MNFLPLLKECNLKATPQRLAVLKALNKHTHPTMDELFEDIRIEYPTISLATVYKNVNALKEVGIITEVNAENGKTKYDIYTKPHVHVICKNCGDIQDLPYCDTIKSYQKSLENDKGFELSSLKVAAYILNCEKCKS